MNRLWVCVLASVVTSAVVSTALVLALRQEHECASLESQELHRRRVAEGKKRDPFRYILTSDDNSEVLKPGYSLTAEAILPQERKLTKVVFKMPTGETYHAEWATVDWDERTYSYVLNMRHVSDDTGQSLWGALGCSLSLREPAHNPRMQQDAAVKGDGGDEGE
ncbi:MAG: hypothetical protein ACYSU0_00050 [Planctomycetota bacterium]|jgi:hypothetical protein